MAFRLPRLPKDIALVDGKGRVSVEFQRWWQSAMLNLETQEQNQDALLQAVIDAQDAATQAQIAADLAQGAADTAQDAADGANSVASLTNSGVTGATITATDAGANVTASVSGHTRVYGDGSSVAVTGGNVTALNYSTLYYIYYDDAARTGGAVTYQATTSETTAAQTGDRHLVGQVTTPAAAAPPNNGDYVAPPGIGNIYF